MKIFSLVCLIVVFMVNSAFAIAPLNRVSIGQAQLYGSSQAKSELLSFLKPWLSYEERAEQLNEKAETAYLYTPFLLIAMDAREKRLHDEAVLIEDSEKIIANYLDTLSFSVKLFGNESDFGKDTIAIIKQNDKIIQAWSAAVPKIAEASAWHDKFKYTVQGYFYFSEKEINIKEPIILVILTGDKKSHSFYFELTKIK